MFKDRALQVSMVKNADTTDTTTTDKTEATLITMGVTARTVGNEAVKVAAAYIILDTARKILINRLSK